MKLDDLLVMGRNYGELQGLFLVFPSELLPRLQAAQKQGDSMRVEPVALSDGRYFLAADLLTEIGEKGFFKGVFNKLNKSNFKLVEVLTKTEIEPFIVVSESP